MFIKYGYDANTRKLNLSRNNVTIFGTHIEKTLTPAMNQTLRDSVDS